MNPSLLHLGPLTVRSYGTMIVIGFFLALALVKFRSRKYDIDWENCLDLAFYLLLAGIVGGKIFFWIVLPSQFMAEFKGLFIEPVTFLKNLGSGFEIFGSIFVGLAVFVLFTRKKKMPLLKTLDLFTPAMPLVHAVGRIGCFLAGCCYGRQCSQDWAVIFNHPDSLAPTGVPLHPSQLYESAGLFFLVIFLLLIEKRVTRVPGRMITVYIAGYTVLRFIVEHFRADQRGEAFDGLLSMTQLLAIFAVIIAAGVYGYLTLRHGRNKLSGTDGQI